MASWYDPPPLACVVCGDPISGVLAELGSLRCQDCRDSFPDDPWPTLGREITAYLGFWDAARTLSRRAVA